MSRIIEYDIISAADSNTLIDRVNERMAERDKGWWEPLGGVSVTRYDGVNEHRGTTYTEYEFNQAMVKQAPT